MKKIEKVRIADLFGLAEDLIIRLKMFKRKEPIRESIRAIANDATDNPMTWEQSSPKTIHDYAVFSKKQIEVRVSFFIEDSVLSVTSEADKYICAINERENKLLQDAFTHVRDAHLKEKEYLANELIVKAVKFLTGTEE